MVWHPRPHSKKVSWNVPSLLPARIQPLDFWRRESGDTQGMVGEGFRAYGISRLHTKLLFINDLRLENSFQTRCKGTDQVFLSDVSPNVCSLSRHQRNNYCFSINDSKRLVEFSNCHFKRIPLQRWKNHFTWQFN